MIYVNQIDYQVPVEVDTGTVSTRMMRIINPFQQFAAQQGAIELCIAVHQARANPSVLEAFCRLFGGTLSSQYLSDDISVGIPLQLLSNRPDVQRKRIYVA